MLKASRRSVLSTALIFTTTLSAFSQDPVQPTTSRKLFPVVSGNSSTLGYVDEKGRVAIPFGFDLQIGSPHETLPRVQFAEGLAPIDDDEKGWGYINLQGKFVIKPQFREADIFSEGLALVTRFDRKLDREVRSYIDTTGAPKIDLPADSEYYPDDPSVLRFKDGLAVSYDAGRDRVGFINTTGQFHIAPQFNEARSFKEGLAAVLVGDKWGFIDKHGKTVLAPTYSAVGDFSEGWAAVELKGDRLGFIDQAGNLKLSTRFWFADTGEFVPPTRSRYRCKEGAWGISPGYEPAFSEGLYPVESSTGAGFIDKRGRLVIAPRFDAAAPFSDGVALVRKGRSYFFIDKKGRSVFRKTYRYANSFHDGLALVFFAWRGQEIGLCGGEEAMLYGYIDRQGKVVFVSTYDYWEQFAGDEDVETPPPVDIRVESVPDGANVYLVPWRVWKFQQHKSLEDTTWLQSAPTPRTFSVQQQKYMVVLKLEGLPFWLVPVPVTDSSTNYVRWVSRKN